MRMVGFNLTDEQKIWLDKRSEETSVPIAALIRMAINLYIKTIEEKENDKRTDRN